MIIQTSYQLVSHYKDLVLPPSPTCCGQMIGHGYYQRYCQDLNQAIKVKRSFCKNCFKTKSQRPLQLVRFFQSSSEIIRKTLYHRLKFKCWPDGFPRQRGGHWLRRLWQTIWGETGPILPIWYLKMCKVESIWLFK